jgi:hypothetical protein
VAAALPDKGCCTLPNMMGIIHDALKEFARDSQGSTVLGKPSLCRKADHQLDTAWLQMGLGSQQSHFGLTTLNLCPRPS